MTSRTKILVVEDDEDIRDSVKELLESENYVVVVAENGRKGLDALKNHSDVQLIILDRMMPHMNGEEFIHQLRGNSAHPYARIPVLVLTATGNFPDPLQSQVDGFIQKPFELTLFLEAVRLHSEPRP